MMTMMLIIAASAVLYAAHRVKHDAEYRQWASEFDAAVAGAIARRERAAAEELARIARVLE